MTFIRGNKSTSNLWQVLKGTRESKHLSASSPSLPKQAVQEPGRDLTEGHQVLILNDLLQRRRNGAPLGVLLVDTGAGTTSQAGVAPLTAWAQPSHGQTNGRLKVTPTPCAYMGQPSHGQTNGRLKVILCSGSCMSARQYQAQDGGQAMTGIAS